jgi:hypothetical protein
MPELTEEQRLNANYKALVEALWNDQELGAKVQAKAKQVIPGARTNADIVDPWLNPLREENSRLAKQMDELRAERAAEKRAQEESSQKHNLETALANARKSYSLTDEGFDQMVSRMKETGNYSDADAAAAWVASKAPPKEVAGPSWGPPQALNLFGSKKYDEGMKALHTDPQGYMDDQLSEFVRNPDKYVADTFRAA